MAFDHEACVDLWFTQSGLEHSPDEFLAHLERALDVLWRRCQLRLGEVTLMAIADRALHEGRVKHTCLAVVSVGAGGIVLEGLKARARDCSIVELNAACRVLLVEFLRIVGRLTAEVLTPALHA